MKTEYILYGLKKDEPNWKEDIMYVSFNFKDMERAKKLAQKKVMLNLELLNLLEKLQILMILN